MKLFESIFVLIFCIFGFISAPWNAKETFNWYAKIKFNSFDEKQLTLIIRICITPVFLVSAYFVVKNVIDFFA